MKRHACAFLLAFVVTACAPSYDLPNDQLLVSPHFRYHARAEAVLDPTITDRLEAHRAEFNQRFGVTNGVTSYYLFRDHDDLHRNSPCPVDADQCTMGDGSVMSYEPFMEHELVHAFLTNEGHPANPIGEGIAQRAACLQPQVARIAAWPGDFALDYYSLGQRLVGWMTTQGSNGDARFIDFYRANHWTADAAKFSAGVEAFWGQSMEALLPTINDGRFGGSSCACLAPAVPTDGTQASFVAGQDYRVLEVGEDSRIQLASDGPIAVLPRDCADAEPAFDGFRASHELPTLTIGRGGPGRYVVAAAPKLTGTVVVSAVTRPVGAPGCDAARAAAADVGRRNVVVWIDHKTMGPTVFSLVLEGPQRVSNFGGQSELSVCRGDCTTDCLVLQPGSFGFEFTPPADGLTTVTISAVDSEKDTIVTIQPQ